MMPFKALFGKQKAPAVVTFAGTTFDTNDTDKTLVISSRVIGETYVVATISTVSANQVVTDSAGGTYTATVATWPDASATMALIFHIRDSFVTGSGSITITSTASSHQGSGIAVWRITGVTKVGALANRSEGQQVNNTSAASVPGPVLSSSPLPASIIFGGFVAQQAGVISARAGYTEDVEANITTPSLMWELMYRNGGETATGINWGASPGQQPWGACCWELDTT